MKDFLVFLPSDEQKSFFGFLHPEWNYRISIDGCLTGVAAGLVLVVVLVLVIVAVLVVVARRAN